MRRRLFALILVPIAGVLAACSEPAGTPDPDAPAEGEPWFEEVAGEVKRLAKAKTGRKRRGK